MNDIVWHHMCVREITSYKSPVKERAAYQEMHRAGTPPITPPEAPRPKRVLPPVYAQLQNLTHKPELNGSEVIVEGPSAIPGRVSVRMKTAHSRKFLVDPSRLALTDPEMLVPTFPQGADAVNAGKLSKDRSMGDIDFIEKHVNTWKRNERDALEAGPKAVPVKGLKALWMEASGQRSPSMCSVRSTTSNLPPRTMYLQPFPDGHRSMPSMPAPPNMELGTACVPLREEEPSIGLSARRCRKGYHRNAMGAFWRRLT